MILRYIIPLIKGEIGVLWVGKWGSGLALRFGSV